MDIHHVLLSSVITHDECYREWYTMMKIFFFPNSKINSQSRKQIKGKKEKKVGEEEVRLQALKVMFSYQSKSPSIPLQRH